MEKLVDHSVSQMDIIRKTFQGRKVFLTGHTGFKGAWLNLWLHLLGAETMGYALSPESPNSLFESIHQGDLGESIIADLRDVKKLKEALKTFQPDFVFHLAAQPLVRRSYAHPLDTYETNILGTAYLLDAIKELDKSCSVVVVTTDKVYSNKEWVYPYREVDPLGGYDPYSSSKAAAEIVVSGYRNSFFNPKDFEKHGVAVATARAGNVIGGGDWSDDRIIPDMIRCFSKGEVLKVRNPDAIRPWQYVLDPLFGYLLLGANLSFDSAKFSEAWNFGPAMDDNLTVKQLVTLSLKYFPQAKVEYGTMEGRPHEAKLLMLDTAKSMSKLNWRSKYSSEEAIHQTIKWYQECGQNAARDLCIEEINKYSSI